MEQGLAHMYGSGEGQSTKHYYAGVMKKTPPKKKTKKNKGK